MQALQHAEKALKKLEEQSQLEELATMRSMHLSQCSRLLGLYCSGRPKRIHSRHSLRTHRSWSSHCRNVYDLASLNQDMVQEHVNSSAQGLVQQICQQELRKSYVLDLYLQHVPNMLQLSNRLFSAPFSSSISSSGCS